VDPLLFPVLGLADMMGGDYAGNNSHGVSAPFYRFALKNARANPGGVIARRSARVNLLASNHSGGFGAAQAKVFTFPLLYRFVIPAGISRTVFRGSLKYPQMSVGFTAGSPNSHCRNVNLGRR
jgi:hypothetical protein